MISGMGKQSMTTLRERRAELGLVQMNLWIREADRAAFDRAIAPFKQRAAEADPPAQRMRPLERVRQSVGRFDRTKPGTPPEPPQKPGRAVIPLPCRLIFPAKPPASLRNQMKDAGWVYAATAGVWSTHDRGLVEIWLDELIEAHGARVLDPLSGD